MTTGMRIELTYLLRRSLGFSRPTRAMFYVTLREYTRNHFSLMQIFDAIAQRDDQPALQEIARLSKKAIRNNQPFAAHYHESGFFNRTEATLLMLGEQHDCLEQVAALLDREVEQPAVAQRVLAPAMQWIFMTLIMILVSLYAAPYLQQYSSGYDWFFDALRVISEYWWRFALAGLLLSVVYRRGRRRLGGRWRRVLLACGCFRLHALLLELRFLIIARVLLPARLPAAEFLQVMEQIFAEERPFLGQLQRGRRRLSEASLMQIIRNLLTPRSYSYLQACAPNETPAELAAGCAMARRMLQAQLEHAINVYRLCCTLAFLSASLLVTIPFALTSMGMGIQY